MSKEQSPYEALKQTADGLIEAEPDATCESMFLTGFELGLGFALYSPDATMRILASIDEEMHIGRSEVASQARARIAKQIIDLLPADYSTLAKEKWRQ